MKYRYLIEFDNPDHAYYSSSFDSPEGERMENVSMLTLPDVSGHRFFAMTANEWPYRKNQDQQMYHHHQVGYETFFIKEGSLDLHINGKRCFVKAGSIVNYRPYEMHAMTIHETVVSRGFFQNYDSLDSVVEMRLLESYDPDARKKMMESRPPEEAMSDFHINEYMDYEKVPVEQVYSVKHPDRPQATFDFDGVKAKLLLARWDLGGLREVWRFEMEKGFHAESVDYPGHRSLIYLTDGAVEVKIYDDEFVADKECLIDIPKNLKYTIKAKTDAKMYEVGGLSGWYNFMHDYTAVKKNNPDKFNDEKYIADLKKKNQIFIKSCGK